MFSNSLLAQKTYWKYEKTTPILSTAIDIEFILSEIKQGDYILFDLNTNDILLYSNSRFLNRPFVFEKNEVKSKIIGDKLKLLYRSGVDNIYMLTFLKANEKDFIKNE